jgi:hypothetical protein
LTFVTELEARAEKSLTLETQIKALFDENQNLRKMESKWIKNESKLTKKIASILHQADQVPELMETISKLEKSNINYHGLLTSDRTIPYGSPEQVKTQTLPSLTQTQTTMRIFDAQDTNPQSSERFRPQDPKYSNSDHFLQNLESFTQKNFTKSHQSQPTAKITTAQISSQYPRPTAFENLNTSKESLIDGKFFFENTVRLHISRSEFWPKISGTLKNDILGKTVQRDIGRRDEDCRLVKKIEILENA